MKNSIKEGGVKNAFRKISSFILAVVMTLGMLPVSAQAADISVIKAFENIPAYDFAVQDITKFDLRDAQILSLPSGVVYAEGPFKDTYGGTETHTAVIGTTKVKQGVNDFGTVSVLFKDVVIDADKNTYDLQIDAHSVWNAARDYTYLGNTIHPILYTNSTGTLWVNGSCLDSKSIDYYMDAYEDSTPLFGSDATVPSGLKGQVATDDSNEMKDVARIRTIANPSVNAIQHKTELKFTVLKNGAAQSGKLLFGMTDLDMEDRYAADVTNGRRLFDADGNGLIETYGTNMRYSESVELTTGAYVTNNSYLLASGNSLYPSRRSATNIDSSFRTLLNANGGSLTHYISQGATRLFVTPTIYKVDIAVVGNYTDGGTINNVKTGTDNRFEKQNASYTVTPKSGYYIEKVYVDGTEIPVTDTSSMHYTFEGITANHKIEASFLPYYQVDYVWDGEHPNKQVPATKTEIKGGDTYNVDTTYTPGMTVYEENVTYGGKTYPRGTWTFNKWDQTGTLTINDNVTIHGTWDFKPEWNIDTEAINGTITESEHNIPDGENRVVTYTPNPGYQLKTLTVDGDPKDIKEYPASYPFNDIDADHEVIAVFELIPALAIEKSSDKEIYNAGDKVTYTIKVSQTVDGAEARDVEINDTLPEGLTLVKDSFEGDVTVVSQEDNTYTLSVASLEKEVTYTYKATTAADIDAEALTNVVNAKGSNVPGDPVEDDNTIKSLLPKPEITKAVSNENPIYGAEITYTISIKEPQEGIVLRNAIMSDPIPEGIEVVEDSVVVSGEEAEVSFKDNTITATLAELKDESVITFKAKVTALTGEVDNIAMLNGDQVEEVKDNALITVKEPEPTIVKIADIKKVSKNVEEITYTITASTDVDLIDAVITDTLPDGIRGVEDITCNYEDATITGVSGATKTQDTETGEETSTDAGSRITISVPLLIKDKPLVVTYKSQGSQVGTWKNVAELKAMNFPKGPISDDETVEVIEPTPVIEKKVDKDSVAVSDTVAYTVAAKTSEGVLTDAVVTDVMPEGVTIITDTLEAKLNGKSFTEGVDATTTGFVVKTDRLSTEDTLVVTFKATVNVEGPHINTATVEGSNYTGEPVKDTAKVTAIEPVPVIEKEVSKQNVSLGEEVSFGIKMHAEKAVLKNAVMTDTLPNGFKIDESTITVSDKNAKISVEGNTMTVTLPTLRDTVVTVFYKGVATETGTLTNVASLTGSNYTGEPVKAEASILVAQKTTTPTVTPTPATTKVTNTTTTSNPKGDAVQLTSVKTGDESNIALYMSLFGVALLGIIGGAVYSKRRH